MKQTSMNISLPADLRDFVDEKLARGRYSSASEYVRELIRADLKREAKDRIDQLLLDGLASGPAKPMTKKDWKEIRSRIEGRVKELREPHARTPRRQKSTG
jgi:antitoxin ParD1/3/4